MMALIVVAALDAFTFGVALLGYPISAEANPLARFAYKLGGLPAVTVGKMIGILLVIAILQRLDGRRRRFGYVAAVTLTAFAAATNVISLALLA